MENQRSKQLLQKYLNGQCTPEEQALVESWYYEISGKQKDKLPESDYLAMKQAVFNAINTDDQQYSNLVTRLWPRIAAAAMILITLSIGFYFYTKDTLKPNETQYANDIGPGGNKATLTLADGSKISLTDAKNGQLAEQSGITITKSADGQLIYTISDLRPQTSDLEYNTIETPTGGQYKIVLPDGTKAWLNAASSLRYPVRFTGKERRVEITGEAYFEVVHNRLMPFMVVGEEQTVKVLGTHFNINSYADEGNIRTTLVEGSVEVSNKVIVKVLLPGQQSVLKNTDLTVTEANIEEAIAWKNGYFRFNGETIENIMRKLSRWYNIEVRYEGKVSDESFYGTISHFKNISEVLKMLELTKGVHFKIEGRRVTVMQ